MIRRTLAAGLMLAALLGAASSASAAQMTVTQAIRLEVKRIDATPAYTSLATLKLGTIAQDRAAIPQLRTIAGLFTSAARVVSAASATAQQQPGKTDWINGAREAARGFSDYASALTLAITGQHSAADRELTRAKATVDAGSTLGRKADTILGLPLSD